MDDATPTIDRLRDDVRLLGALLGDTIREQLGDETLDLVEGIRRISVRFRRKQEREARSDLESLLAGWRTTAAWFRCTPSRCLRNFPTSRRTCTRTVSRPRGAWRAVRRGPGASRMRSSASGWPAWGPPTSASCSGGRAARPCSPPIRPRCNGRASSIGNVRSRVSSPNGAAPICSRTGCARTRRRSAARSSMWQTRLVRPVRISVVDEIENGLDYHRRTFLREVPRLHAELEDALAGDEDGAQALPVLLRIGSWIGSDRDGNPFVTAETLRYAAERQSALVLSSISTRRTTSAPSSVSVPSTSASTPISTPCRSALPTLGAARRRALSPRARRHLRASRATAKRLGHPVVRPPSPTRRPTKAPPSMGAISTCSIVRSALVARGASRAATCDACGTRRASSASTSPASTCGSTAARTNRWSASCSHTPASRRGTRTSPKARAADCCWRRSPHRGHSCRRTSTTARWFDRRCRCCRAPRASNVVSAATRSRVRSCPRPRASATCWK